MSKFALMFYVGFSAEGRGSVAAGMLGNDEATGRPMVLLLHKAHIDNKIGKYLVPETVRYEWKDSDYHD